MSMNKQSLFDATFFKFLIGFTFILTLSFAILFFVGRATVSTENGDATAQIIDTEVCGTATC
jgi:hypothetical protein